MVGLRVSRPRLRRRVSGLSHINILECLESAYLCSQCNGANDVVGCFLLTFSNAKANGIKDGSERRISNRAIKLSTGQGKEPESVEE